jgi:predicted Zn-dependent protease
MPPKKNDPKKPVAVAGQAPTFTITEDELNEAKTLPTLNDFVFTNLYAFRMLRNHKRLTG